MSEGKTVLFAGDGKNDAVDVTQADVGVQIGGTLAGRDVTRSAADVVLLVGLEGHPLPPGHQNCQLPLYGLQLCLVCHIQRSGHLTRLWGLCQCTNPPAYAGFGEIVSVLPVVFSAMTMLFTHIRADG